MHSQLGTFIFEGRLSPSASQRTYETNYVEHPLIENRPTVQRIGEKLRVLNLAMVLDQSFCNPSEVISNMESSRSVGEILPLIMGDGRYFGTYVIKKMTITEEWNAPDGTLLNAGLQIELLEYFDPDAEASQRISDISSGFAMLSNDPPAFTPVIVPIIPEAQAMAGVVASNATSSNAARLMESIGVVAEKYRSKADTITQNMLQTGDSLAEVLSIIDSDPTSEMYDRTRNLASSISIMQVLVSDVVLECSNLIADIDAGNTADIPDRIADITDKAVEVKNRNKQIRDDASSLTSYAATL